MSVDGDRGVMWLFTERIRGWAAEVAMELLSLDRPERLHA